MTIKVHHLNHSRSLRALWLLEELGLDYTLQHWKRDAGFRAPIEATKVHPLGRFPMVEVDGHVLVESGAILEYFAEREHKLLPTTPEARARCRFYMHYAEGSVMPPTLVQLVLDKTRAAKLPFFIKPLVGTIVGRMEQGYSLPEIARHFGFIEGELAQRSYFAGDEFSIADIQMYYAAEAGLARGAGSRPNLQTWIDRVRAREAFQRAEAKGGPAISR